MATVYVRPAPAQIVVTAAEEFCQRWLSGLMPSLYIETAPDGEIRVQCQVHAGGAGHDQGRRYQVRREGVENVRYRGAAYRRRLDRRARERAEEVVDLPAPVAGEGED